MQDGITLDVLLDMLVFEDLESANEKLAPYSLVANWVEGSENEVEVRTFFGGYVCRVGKKAVEGGILTVADRVTLDDAINEAGAAMTTAQEDSEDAEPLYGVYASPYLGAVKEGDNDDYALELEERFRFLLTHPDSRLTKLLRFYAHGELDTSGDVGVPQVPKNYEPKVDMPLAGKSMPVSDVKSVESTSDARTVNNTVRHSYRVLNDEEKADIQYIKDLGLEFIEYIDSVGSSREMSIAKTKIEEAVMWAVKSITK